MTLNSAAATFSLALPSAFHRSIELEPHLAQHATLDLVVAIVLLCLYGLFLLYSLRTHPETFAELNAPAAAEEPQPKAAEGFDVPDEILEVPSFLRDS